MRNRRWTLCLLLPLTVCLVCLAPSVPVAGDPEPEPENQPPPARESVARGVVFHDQNGNGTRDEGEPGVPGVCVSNQLDVVATGEDGSYELPITDDTRIFVVKPRNWQVPIGAHQLPRFHYNHKPKGSPALRYPGVRPTGDLPASIDFALTPRVEPDTFRVLYFADPQPYSIKQVDYVAHDIVAPLVNHGREYAFGVTLGDIVGDNLHLFEPLNAAIGRIGIPWYNVIGNHDVNYRSPDDEHSDETFERVYAPSYYSWNYGQVHFVALDDVHWNGRRYHGSLGSKQIQWLQNDLAQVPEGVLVVVMMHIPLRSMGRSGTVNVDDRRKLYEVLASRKHLTTLSGHMHTHFHQFIGADDGWPGGDENPLEHIHCVTASGNWWGGVPDERGIPDAMMSDGAPNGYMIGIYEGNTHRMQFRAASRPADYQMEIHAPNAQWDDRLDETPIYANVFGASNRSTVEFRLGNGEWQPMQQVRNGGQDLARLVLDLQLRPYSGSTHLWRATLGAGAPEGLTPDSHLIQVRTTDVYQQTFTGNRVIRVQPAGNRPQIMIDGEVQLKAGAAAVLRVENMTGNEIRVLVPVGADNEDKLVTCVRLGNMIRFAVPDNLGKGSIRVVADGFYISDPRPIAE